MIIGLTLVSIGTSLPELATNVYAAMVDQGSVAIGNVVGSNILNLLLIVGISALIRPLVFSSEMLKFDVPVMIGFTLFLWLMFIFRTHLRRAFGGILLLLYVVYLACVI